MKVIQTLKSIVVKFPLGRQARDFYWKARQRKLEARGWKAEHLREAFPLPASVECVFRAKSAPNPLANRHSFRLKSALVPKQIGTPV